MRPLPELVDALRAMADGDASVEFYPEEAEMLLAAIPNRDSKNIVLEITRGEFEPLAWAVWFSYPAARENDAAPLHALGERLLFLRRQLLQF